MKNPFDPFGVFDGWKGQTPDEEPSWDDNAIQEILDEHHEQIDSVIAEAAWAGIVAERNRCLDIIRQNIKSQDEVDRVVQLIQGLNDE